MKIHLKKPADFESPSRDYRVKIVEFLQQNWAPLIPSEDGGVTVLLIDAGLGGFGWFASSSSSVAILPCGEPALTATPKIRNCTPFYARYPRHSTRRNTRMRRVTHRCNSGNEGRTGFFVY